MPINRAFQRLKKPRKTDFMSVLYMKERYKYGLWSIWWLL
nr:MAG TPA: hypothetical protein [Bacteriophage sp.]